MGAIVIVDGDHTASPLIIITICGSMETSDYMNLLLKYGCRDIPVPVVPKAKILSLEVWRLTQAITD